MIERLLTNDKFVWFNNRGGLLYTLGLGLILIGLAVEDYVTVALGFLDILIGVAIYLFSKKKGLLDDEEDQR